MRREAGAGDALTVSFPIAPLIFLGFSFLLLLCWGWLGGAMVLGKLPVPGRPTIRITVGQGPTALAVGAGGGCLEFFYSSLSFLSSFSGVVGWCDGAG